MTTTTRETDALAREIPFLPDGEVRITLATGALHIRGVDGDSVRIRSLDDVPLDRVVRVDRDGRRLDVRPSGDGSLRIGPLTIGAAGPADLEIELPRATRVTTQVASADVVASGLTGDTEWGSASGDLRLRFEGGAVRFHTMSGDVDIDAGGELRVDGRTVSGDARIRAPRIAELRLATTSGDIEIAGGFGAGPHTIATISGTTTLTTRSGIRVETSTVTGDVRVHGVTAKRDGRQQVIGDGTAAVGWRSMSGDLTVRGGEPAETPEPHVADLGHRDAATAEAGRAGWSPTTTEPAPSPSPHPPEPVVVAEASAAPNLYRTPPSPLATDGPDPVDERVRVRRSRTEQQEVARLEVLRAVERGELGIDEASTRLAALDDVPLSSGGAV